MLLFTLLFVLKIIFILLRGLLRKYSRNDKRKGQYPFNALVREEKSRFMVDWNFGSTDGWNLQLSTNSCIHYWERLDMLYSKHLDYSCCIVHLFSPLLK